MDSEALKRICLYQNIFSVQLQNWSLDSAYWSLRILWMNFAAKPAVKDNALISADFTKLDKVRMEYFKNKEDQKSRANFYVELEKTYINITILMKKHGIIFREGDNDPRSAVLR